MASQALTNAQKDIRRALSNAESTVLAYAAPTVPPLNNLTVEGMVEDLGYINQARKSLEKTEKILKERLKSQLGERREVRSDNFTMKLEDRPRTALDQGKAKAYFEEQGTLADFMSTTAVSTMTIKEN